MSWCVGQGVPVLHGPRFVDGSHEQQCCPLLNLRHVRPRLGIVYKVRRDARALYLPFVAMTARANM